LTHAICNALWTAIGKGSLSLYADKMCLERWIENSLKYLESIYVEVKKSWYEIGNIACSIEAAKPKLEKHIPQMKAILSQTLNCVSQQIGIACTTGEKLTDFGKGLGIQCFVHCILVKSS
jgi:2-C-methyl-D-erythritol 2,4-cyclodiphosphate synthase